MGATTRRETYQADLAEATARFARGGMNIDWATPETLSHLNDNIVAAFEATWSEGITIDEWVNRAVARMG